MSNATTRQIATITKLLNTREHEDTGKTIRVGATRFRTTTERITTISKAVASRMIDALLDAPVKDVPTAPAHPHFTKSAINPSRSAWVVANGHPDWKAGDIVEIRTASGATRRVALQSQGTFGLAERERYATEIYWDVIDAALVEQTPAVDETVEDTVEDTVEVEQATQRPAPARRRAGWSRRTRSCPTCGEDEGGMYNHGRCDECGHADDWAAEDTRQIAEMREYEREIFAPDTVEEDPPANEDVEDQGDTDESPTDRLDRLLEEHRALQAELHPLMFTTDGDLRTRTTAEETARIDALMDQSTAIGRDIVRTTHEIADGARQQEADQGPEHGAGHPDDREEASMPRADLTQKALRSAHEEGDNHPHHTDEDRFSDEIIHSLAAQAIDRLRDQLDAPDLDA